MTRFWELQVCKIDSLNSKNSKKNCPKLLPTVQLDLVELVKKELKVEPVGVDVEHLNPAGSEPLLPALGNKLGLSVDRILALGYEYYAQDLGVSVVRATNEVFFDKMVVKSYMSQLQHGWLSAIAKAESYNEPFVKLKNSVKMLNFSLLKNFR